MVTFPVPPSVELWQRLADLERMAALGMRAVRVPLLWEELAPHRDDEIDWRFADALMQ